LAKRGTSGAPRPDSPGRSEESASVPTGVLHTFKKRSGASVRARNVHRPAARFEDYIQPIYKLTHARGITGAKDLRAPVYLSMLMLEYPETLAPGLLGLQRLAGASQPSDEHAGVIPRVAQPVR